MDPNHPESTPRPPLRFATDPVDEIHDGGAIRPDITRSNLKEYWQEWLRQRQKSSPDNKRQAPEKKRQEKDQSPAKPGIDDYA